MLARNIFSYNEREFPFANDDLKKARNVFLLKVSISITKHPILATQLRLHADGLKIALYHNSQSGPESFLKEIAFFG